MAKDSLEMVKPTMDRGHWNYWTTNRPVPISIRNPAFQLLRQISTGDGGACALDRTFVQCWGDNTQGQLGDGTNDDSNIPARSGESDATQISVGFSHSCAVQAGGTVTCWGLNGEGQLGSDSTTVPISTTPLQVEGITTAATQVSAGGQPHLCFAGRQKN